MSYDLYLWSGADRAPDEVLEQLLESGSAGLAPIRAGWLVEVLKRHMPGDALRIFREPESTCIQGFGWECIVTGEETELIALQASWQAVKTDEGWGSLTQAAQALADELSLTVYDGQTDEVLIQARPAMELVFWSGDSGQPPDVTWLQLQEALPDGVRALRTTLVQRQIQARMADEEIVVDDLGASVRLRGCGWSCTLGRETSRFMTIHISPDLIGSAASKARRAQIIGAFTIRLDCSAYHPKSGWFQAGSAESPEVKLLRDLWGTP